MWDQISTQVRRELPMHTGERIVAHAEKSISKELKLGQTCKSMLLKPLIYPWIFRETLF